MSPLLLVEQTVHHYPFMIQRYARRTVCTTELEKKVLLAGWTEVEAEHLAVQNGDKARADLRTTTLGRGLRNKSNLVEMFESRMMRSVVYACDLSGTG